MFQKYPLVQSYLMYLLYPNCPMYLKYRTMFLKYQPNQTNRFRYLRLQKIQDLSYQMTLSFVLESYNNIDISANMCNRNSIQWR